MFCCGCGCGSFRVLDLVRRSLVLVVGFRVAVGPDRNLLPIGASHSLCLFQYQYQADRDSFHWIHLGMEVPLQVFCWQSLPLLHCCFQGQECLGRCGAVLILPVHNRNPRWIYPLIYPLDQTFSHPHLVQPGVLHHFPADQVAICFQEIEHFFHCQHVWVLCQTWFHVLRNGDHCGCDASCAHCRGCVSGCDYDCDCDCGHGNARVNGSDGSAYGVWCAWSCGWME